MIKLSILYPNEQSARFDVDYYLNKHMPFSISCFGEALKGISVDLGIAAFEPILEPEYIIMTHMVFESMDAFEEAFRPYSQILQDDMLAYTDIRPIYQFSEVQISR
jgi:uncharacterized protein (TIGR02118 family)